MFEKKMCAKIVLFHLETVTRRDGDGAQFWGVPWPAPRFFSPPSPPSLTSGRRNETKQILLVVDGMSIFIFMNFVVCCVVKQLNSHRYVWKGSEYLTCHQLIRI